jgi:hypothetical protein
MVPSDCTTTSPRSGQKKVAPGVSLGSGASPPTPAREAGVRGEPQTGRIRASPPQGASSTGKNVRTTSQLAEKAESIAVLKGHELTRADNARDINTALAAEGRSSCAATSRSPAQRAKEGSPRRKPGVRGLATNPSSRSGRKRRAANRTDTRLPTSGREFNRQKCAHDFSRAE